MRSIYKFEKQGDVAPLSYQPGQGPAEAAQPQYFDSLGIAEKHLTKMGCDVTKVLNGPMGRIYKSHLGTFSLIELAIYEDSDV